MTDSTSSQADSGSIHARAYNLVLTEHSSSPRVRALIQEFSHVDRETAEDWMANPPMAILENRPLQEVVDLRTRLMRLGVGVRIEESGGDVPVSPEQKEPTEEADQVVDASEPDKGASTEPAPAENQPDFDDIIPPRSGSAKPGGLLSSRFWTCLISILIVGAALLLFTLWMLNSMRSRPINAIRDSSSRSSGTPSDRHRPSLPAYSDQTYKPTEIARDVNDAIRNRDGASASRILHNYDRIQQVDNLAAALEQNLQPVSQLQPSSDSLSTVLKNNDLKLAGKISGDGILAIDPSVISMLRELKSRLVLSKSPEVNWEITGTSLTGWTDLPEQTAIGIDVTIANGSSSHFTRRVQNRKISLPPFPELPSGEMRIETKLVAFGDQPSVIQRSMDLQTIPHLEERAGLSELDVPERITPIDSSSLDWASSRIEQDLRDQGVEASASGLGVGTTPEDSLLIIKGQSQDVFAFVKSSILAAGLITMSLNDPPIWVLVEVNTERYWIESYLCRQAIRNYAENDPAVNNYLLNSLITL